MKTETGIKRQGNENVLENNIMERFINMMRQFSNVKGKRLIICHSAEDMNRKADVLIEQGFQVERQSGVLPVQLLCIATYRVVFWK